MPKKRCFICGNFLTYKNGEFACLNCNCTISKDEVSHSHKHCKNYIAQYDACRKFCESNMSQRTRLCKCEMRISKKRNDFK